MERGGLLGLGLINSMKKLPFFLPFGGCRGRCVYCSQNTITGASEIPSSEYVSSVLSELDEPREVCFFGGSFCRFGISKVKEYLDSVVKYAPEGSRIRFSTYPGDLSDISMRNLIKIYPISCIELGIPSLDPNVLSLCKRETDPDTVLNDIKTIMNESLPLGVQMMIGLPGQTKESSINDLKNLAGIKGAIAWDLRLYPCLVHEGTELEDMMTKGSYIPLALDQAIEWGGIFIDRAVSLGFNPIRIGLQESELLASKVKGGPHHPALGEMIASESLVRKLTRNNWTGPWIVPEEHISKFTGHGCFGLRRLAELTGTTTTAVSEKLSFFPPAGKIL